MKRLPFFLSMRGCPRQCSYCNQRIITGKAPSSPDEVAERLKEEQSPLEVCYFGGSFTCLPPDERKNYLEAFGYAPPGSVLRLSTHPECIDHKVLEGLRPYPLSQLELGVSSLENHVLTRNYRGYTEDKVLEVIASVLKKGIPLGCQMMIGLPGQTLEGSLADLKKLHDVAQGREITLRLYPTLVLRGTPLAIWQDQGTYTPLTVEKAILWGAAWLEESEKMGFPVQRIGLCETPDLSRDVLGGPLHPALGEQIRGMALAKKLLSQTPRGPWNVKKKHLSWLFGHGARGARHLATQNSITLEEVKRRIAFDETK